MALQLNVNFAAELSLIMKKVLTGHYGELRNLAVLKEVTHYLLIAT